MVGRLKTKDQWPSINQPKMTFRYLFLQVGKPVKNLN